MISSSSWDRWFRICSVVCTALVVPGVGWAWSLNERVLDLNMQVHLVQQRIESQQKADSGVADELRALRVSVEQMRGEIQQRLTRVETRLEAK
jgi:Tfp pilus assembly protein PilO